MKTCEELSTLNFYWNAMYYQSNLGILPDTDAAACAQRDANDNIDIKHSQYLMMHKILSQQTI